MKDTPETRDRLIGQIAKGADARELLKQLDPKFVDLRERYRAELVGAVRSKADGEQIALIACRVTALEDLYESIYQDAVTGARAQEMANVMEAESGKH